MSLAPFFDKAALAASAVLHGFDLEQFSAVLEAHAVNVSFDNAAAESFEGQTTLMLSVNLLARLYPTLVLRARGIEAVGFRSELVDLARAINPGIEILTDETATTGKTSVALIVGETAAAVFGVSTKTTVIYVGSSGWEARVSSSHPVGSGATYLPFGAAAAACIGVANVFRYIFRSQLPHADLDKDLSLSTLTLETRLGSDVPTREVVLNVSETDPGDVDLGEIVLVGAGAVGEGVVWTLARMRHLRGTLHVVDNQVADATNPQRYPLATSADVDRAKVALVAEVFRPDADHIVLEDPSATRLSTASEVRRVPDDERAALEIVPHEKSWGAFLAARRHPWRLKRVLVALDSARDRIAVQCALPKWVANAWTQPGDLGLSRHAGLGVSSCMGCLYIPTEKNAKNEDVVVAEAVGLVGNEMIVRQLLATGAGVDETVIRLMAAGLGVLAEPLLRFIGRPLRAFYSEAVCGGIVLRLQSAARAAAAHANVSDSGADTAVPPPVVGGQPTDRGAMVPMAFQSVLAGVLLAAAGVADAAALPAPRAGLKVVMDLLRPLGSQLLVPIAPPSSGKCICQDPDYQAAFEAQWAGPDP